MAGPRPVATGCGGKSASAIGWTGPPLDPARAHAIVHCVREVITNTLRHAQATKLVVTLEQGMDGSICVTTRDDGRGGRFVEGSGLAGMRERFGGLGGDLTIASLPGQGFSIRAAIPASSAYT